MLNLFFSNPGDDLPSLLEASGLPKLTTSRPIILDRRAGAKLTASFGKGGLIKLSSIVTSDRTRRKKKKEKKENRSMAQNLDTFTLESMNQALIILYQAIELTFADFLASFRVW